MANKVLVLGGSYFVGRKMVEFLAGHGYAVTVLNRGTRPLSVEGGQQICCDRNDGEGMKAALAGKSFAWFLENRENISFKANVDKNLYEIIAELSV